VDPRASEPGDAVRAPLLRALRVAGLPLTGLEPMRPGGLLWRATGTRGAWVVRVADEADGGELTAAMAWAETLSAEGVPVPRPWREAGAVAPRLVRVGRGWALVTEWTLGTAVAERGWDEASADALGRLLARAHAAATAVPAAAHGGARRYDPTWAAGAWTRLAIERSLPDLDAREGAVVRAGLAVARQVLAAAWAAGPGGPVALVHADVHAGNVFEVRRDEDGVALALIDLDRVGLAPVGLDLAFALLEHADATAWACLRGYRSVADLDDGFEDAYAAFRLLATVDNLAFLGGIEHERRFVAAAWPGLVAASAALASPRAAANGSSARAGSRGR
jgi:Ser/Thr protein kinase RdoA (MazF antagonist)